MNQTNTMSNPPPAQHVKPALSQRRKRVRAVNIGCGIALYPVLLFLIATIGITLKLALPVLIFGFGIIPFFFKRSEKTGKCRIPLLISRIIGITLTAAALAAPLICLNFKRMPLLYRAKQFVFSQGVRSSPLTAHSILPKKLPSVCKDYYFRTEPCMPAQDYVPSAYFFIHTDQETLKQYAEKLESYKGVTCYQNQPLSEAEYVENRQYCQPDQLYQLNRPPALPSFVYEQLIIAGFTDDLSHAYTYFPSRRAGQWYIGSGALINYETGLYLVWI